MRFDIVTTFPGIFDSYFGASILKRAQEKGLVEIRTHNPRDFSRGKKRRTVDDAPYGGGAGMVLMAEPIARAVSSIRNKVSGSKKPLVILLSAKGKPFNQKMAYDWSRKYKQLVLISGRYEGIDERVRPMIHDSGFMIQEVSIGPYVLTDGDVAAMAIVSAVSRLIPGVIKLGSLAEESHWNLLMKKERSATKKGEVTLSEQSASKGLEYPHYTRPEVFRWNGKAYRVPPALVSGDHKKIAEWRARRAG